MTGKACLWVGSSISRLSNHVWFVIVYFVGLPTNEEEQYLNGHYDSRPKEYFVVTFNEITPQYKIFFCIFHIVNLYLPSCNVTLNSYVQMAMHGSDYAGLVMFVYNNIVL